MRPRKLQCASEVTRSENAQYAYVIGAATALVEATTEKTFSYENISREKNY